MSVLAINYLELQSRDLQETETFYSDLFGWTFTQHGPDYMSFDNAGLSGGFFRTDDPQPGENRTILHEPDLEKIRDHVTSQGVELTRDIYSFPGGRRFEFNDPSGNRLAVWAT